LDHFDEIQAVVEMCPASVDPSQMWVQWSLKRLFDITGALVLILILLPVLLVCGLLIKGSSRGPVFFMQHRTGLLGREFVIFKLRTMRLGAEQAANKDGRLVKPKNDLRVTPVGRLLRVSSLDEAPQLFNVLFGQMSLIGPRPLMPHMLAPYPDFARIRNRVRPGITGLWQIRERENSTHVRFMAKHDLEYLKNFSLGLDLKILMMTPLIVLSGKGAR
jgi:exopolysaccharide production protein ExoY